MQYLSLVIYEHLFHATIEGHQFMLRITSQNTVQSTLNQVFLVGKCLEQLLAGFGMFLFHKGGEISLLFASQVALLGALRPDEGLCY